MNAITAGDRGDNTNSTTSSTQDQLRQRLQSKVSYIESQIDALPGFLPESYQYLMHQLDQYQQQLLAIMLRDEFDAIDAINATRVNAI